jgi:hypothetical protein
MQSTCFKKTAEEPEINEKYWTRTLQKIKEYLASQYGVTGATLDYVVHPDIAVKPEAEDPAENYETVDQEMTTRAPHMARSFVDDRRKVWDIMSNICGKKSFFVYIKPTLRTRNMLICSFLTIALAPKMWETWPVRQIPSSLAPSTTVKRSVSHRKLMSGFTLKNIQSSMD